MAALLTIYITLYDRLNLNDFNNNLINKIIYGRKKQETLRGSFDEGI